MFYAHTSNGNYELNTFYASQSALKNQQGERPLNSTPVFLDRTVSKSTVFM